MKIIVAGAGPAQISPFERCVRDTMSFFWREGKTRELPSVAR